MNGAELLRFPFGFSRLDLRLDCRVPTVAAAGWVRRSVIRVEVLWQVPADDLCQIADRYNIHMRTKHDLPVLDTYAVEECAERVRSSAGTRPTSTSVLRERIDGRRENETQPR
jgi:hypothetical protein